MSRNLNIAELLDAIALLDSESPPGGLYVTGTQPIVRRVLLPKLKSLGYRIETRIDNDEIHYTAPETGVTAGAIVEMIAKVKVRLFGDKRVTDARVKYADRWDEKRMQKKLSEMWSGHRNVECIVLIGFEANSPLNIAPFPRSSAYRSVSTAERIGARQLTLSRVS